MSYLKQTLQHQYSHWFFNVVWLKHYLNGDRLRRWAAVLAITLGIIIGLQFLYPRNLALPRTRINGAYIGFASRESITNKVSAENNHPLTVKTETEEFQMALQDAGIIIDGTATANRALEYTWRERLIPLSWLFNKRHINQYSFVTEPQKTEALAHSLAQNNKEAVDANIKIQDATVAVEPGQNGYRYVTSDVQKQIEQAPLNKQLKITIKPSIVEPNITTVAAEQTAQKVRERTALPLQLTVAGQTITIDSNTIASWYEVIPVASEKTIKAELNREKVKATIKSLSSKVYIAETPERVVIVDGESRGTVDGTQGQALLLDATVDEVLVATYANQSQVEGRVVAISPSTQFVRTYSKTSKGLQALIDYWAKTHGGQFGIVIRSTDGTIVAAHNGNQQFTSASIYKLYIAYLAYNRVKSGVFSLDSVETCIDGMIVHSYNTCAHTLGDRLGWAANDAELHAKGYQSTTITYGGHITTANDVATLLMQLQSATLNGGDYDELLLSKMRRQVYRMGIPAGVKGMVVANKIGDYGTYQHDAAIVYHPKGAYVISVLSSGSSLWTISDLSRQVAEAINQ